LARNAMPGWNPEGKTTTERGYGWQWQKRRLAVLRAEPLCRPCRAKGKVTPAAQVDHIKPKAQGGADDADNLQPICAECHVAKTAQESAEAQGRRMKPTIGADGWPV